jgi:Putative Flp pilus-assembly TadE/G-like
MTGTTPARCGDRGSITPLIPIVLVALFFLGGLVVDGSRDLNARGDAQSFAEEAARAGATAVDFTQPTLTLDEGLARQRVADYCDQVLKNTTVTVEQCGLATDQAFSEATNCDGQKSVLVVHTAVRLKIGTTLLGMFGPSTLTASGHAKARPFEGTNAQNAC